MAFPTVAVTTTNLDAGGDSQANARPDLLDGMQKLNQFIADQAKIVRTDGTPAPVLLVLEVSGRNAGGPISNLGGTPQTVVDLDLGTVTAGQRIEVNACAGAAGESGQRILEVLKTTGSTAVVQFSDNQTSAFGADYAPTTGATARPRVSAVAEVTTGGSLTLRLQASAHANSNAVIATDAGQMSARVLSA